MAKTAQIVAHVERSVRDSFEELAKADGRTLSAYVERLLIAHLGKRKPAAAKAKKIKT